MNMETKTNLLSYAVERQATKKDNFFYKNKE